ncbi:MAG: hypothetical protein LBV44_01280 [Methylobacillus sp.]|jgi:hypothetical protein|nr:hypothetical protein [Methylobacillus sp.]
MEQNPLPEQPAETQPDRGSIWLGFGLFWVVAIVGGVVWWLLTMGLSIAWLYLPAGITSWLSSGLAIVALLVPLAFAAWMAVRGRTRTALGVVLGYALAIALPLLAISICIGLVGGMGNIGR